jgi:tRNA threonylcarbamoyladenosine biosynthesis protein TsaE
VHNKTFYSESPDETMSIGLALAKELVPHSCVILSGPLGAGKTQFIKGLCTHFGIDESQVHSPTYSIHHSYTGTMTLHHFDLYRLKDTQEFYDRGFIDTIEHPDPILIEWPCRISENVFCDKKLIKIQIEPESLMKRKISIYHE